MRSVTKEFDELVKKVAELEKRVEELERNRVTVASVDTAGETKPTQ